MCDSFEFNEPSYDSINDSVNDNNQGTPGNIQQSTPKGIASGGKKARLIFNKYPLIAPALSSEDEHEETFWDQVIKVRNVMLEKKMKDDFNFNKQDVARFNNFALEKYPDLPERLQYHTMIAYLDEDAWKVAVDVVDQMGKGDMGSKRLPTTCTFRYLHGCRSPQEKKDRLVSHLQKLKMKDFLTHPGSAKKFRAEGNESSKRLQEELKDAKLEIVNLKKIKEQQAKEIIENHSEIRRLNNTITRYGQRISYLELKVATEEQRRKQAEHSKDLCIRNMTVCKDQWRKLYQHQAYIESESLELMHTSTSNSLSAAKSREQTVKKALQRKKRDSPIFETSTKEIHDTEDETEGFLRGVFERKRPIELDGPAIEKPKDVREVEKEETAVSAEREKTVPNLEHEERSGAPVQLVGEFGAVAYSGGKFYIGQILARTDEVEDDDDVCNEKVNEETDLFVEKPFQAIKMKFFYWSKSNKLLYWPTSYEDIEEVNGKFIFRNDIRVFKSERKDGHFYSMPSYYDLKVEFIAYKEKYDLK